WFGYVAGSPTQTSLATTGIIGLLSIGPSLSYLILYWLTRFYKLDDKTMKQIQTDLARRHAAPQPATKQGDSVNPHLTPRGVA
ncbi:MFS transporter, partial [Pectobacterium versatile]|nr:MFS transporter [Pectobacterium versatile]